MIKRISCFFCAVIVCLGLLPATCAAASPDPDRSCSLTVYYNHLGIAFPDLEIELYRVAELRANGEYQLIEPFSGYPINIHGIISQKEWQDMAQTIRSYIIADQITPTQIQKTNEAGTAAFTGLKTGLYLVKGVKGYHENEMFEFRDFMVFLPAAVNGDYDYDVEARPKYTHTDPPETYTVVKVWNDFHYVEQRPQSVSVDILRDGVVQQNVVLSGANNWVHTWTVPGGDEGVWTVMERDVPAGYQVSITENVSTFVVTNSRPRPDKPDIPDEPDDPDTPDDPDEPDEPDDPDTPDDPDEPDIPDTPDTPDEPDIPDTPDVPDTPDEPDEPDEPDVPKTGDTAPLLLYMIIMCISGFGLMILGFRALRGKGNEKNR